MSEMSERLREAREKAGYMEGMKIARLFRDAPEAWIGEGTNEIQLHVVAKTMGLL